MVFSCFLKVGLGLLEGSESVDVMPMRFLCEIS